MRYAHATRTDCYSNACPTGSAVYRHLSAIHSWSGAEQDITRCCHDFRSMETSVGYFRNTITIARGSGKFGELC